MGIFSSRNRNVVAKFGLDHSARVDDDSLTHQSTALWEADLSFFDATAGNAAYVAWPTPRSTRDGLAKDLRTTSIYLLSPDYLVTR